MKKKNKSTETNGKQLSNIHTEKNGKSEADTKPSVRKKSISKTMRNALIIIIAIVELLVFVSGYSVGVEFTKNKYKINTDSHENIAEENGKTQNETGDSDITPSIEVNKQGEDETKAKLTPEVEEILKNMSLEEKIYQLMFVTPEAITGVGNVIQAGEATKSAIDKYPVGGIIYFSPNFESVEQTKTMIANTQKYSDIPLFIAVDEEGGMVSRIGDNKNMGTTKHPPMREIGDTKDPTKAFEVGSTLAKELTELGFNVDFAPVADVIIDEKNTEIGNRSFGTDADLVSKMVRSAVVGMETNGISATLKHFPGHGSTVIDSHTGYSDSSRTLDELRNCEFKPFEAGIKEGVDFIMVSHMTLKNVVKEKVPSSLSKEVITDMLKTELGYGGIVITDSLSMGAITEHYSDGEASAKAIEAGADMVLMSADIDAAFNGIKAAVDSGKITEERLNESVRKILSLKIEKKLIK